jgi:hypothetical protein
LYSTSTDIKPEKEASEPVETLKTQAIDDGSPADAAEAVLGASAKERQPPTGPNPRERPLSNSRAALKALRNALAREDTATSVPEAEVKPARGRSRDTVLRRVIGKAKGKEGNQSPEAAKVKKDVAKDPKVTKGAKDSKPSKPQLVIRRLKPRSTPSFKSLDVNPQDQDGRTKEAKKPLARKVLSTSAGSLTNGGYINHDDSFRLGNVAGAFLTRNPSILQKIIESNLVDEPERKIIPVKRALAQLLQEGKLSRKDQVVALQELKRLIDTKSSQEERPVVSSIKNAMTSKAPSRRRAGAPVRSTATCSTTPPSTVKKTIRNFKPGPISAKPGMTAHEIKTIEATELELVPIDKEPLDIPGLSYGLERVLFNPGVYHLQDPRSRVFNFDPYLQTIMPVNEFDFNALKQYITSSRDQTLLSKAKMEEKKYTGSSSSMTSALAHFHFLLSQWRPVNTGTLSKMFPVEYDTFTALQRSPVAVFLRWRDGTYAIDADKEYDNSNILMMLGKSMEKLLTLSTDDFEKYRKANSEQISEAQRNESEPYHYTTIGDFLLRSQLDAHDPRLPGTGTFDLKTRAVVSVRMDAEGYEEGRGYQILGRHGEWESYEREYYDMIRAAFLKYSLQVRMGRMDGIFVAFHNTERIFGFQYISLPEMDYALHGTDNIALGDAEFKLSLELLNRVLDRATAKFPEKSLRLHFETRDGVTPFMYIFAEPVEEVEIEEIQATNKKKIEEFESTVLGLATSKLTEEQKEAEWAVLRAKVEEKMEQDELGIESLNAAEEKRNEKLDELSAEEQQTVDDLLATTAGEEDGEEDDEDEDMLEDSEEKDEQYLEEDEGGEEESEECVLENANENVEESDLEEQTTLEEGTAEDMEESDESPEESDSDEDSILEESVADDVDESDESLEETDSDEKAILEEGASLEQSDPDEQATAEDVLDEDVQEIDSVDDGAEEDEGFVEEESNEDERENAELVENKELTSHETSSDSNIDGTAAATSTATNTGEFFDTFPPLKPLLAMTLTIRNKVDDLYVERPKDLREDQKWAVEYALSEVPDLERAHRLYEELKMRRHNALNKVVDHDKDAWNNVYIENIKKLSRKGKAWREQQDKIEAEMPTKTLDKKEVKKMSSKDRDVWQGHDKSEQT